MVEKEFKSRGESKKPDQGLEENLFAVDWEKNKGLEIGMTYLRLPVYSIILPGDCFEEEENKEAF